MPRLLTPANQLTILRLVFIPIFVILEIQRDFGWALAVLIAAAVLDGVDGLVARVFHQETSLGVALDPIADKLLMSTAYFILSVRHALPWWITIIVFSRDVGIVMTALVISLVAGYRPFRPTVLGKVSTLIQFITVFLAAGHQTYPRIVPQFVVETGIWLTLIFTVASGVNYLMVAQRRLGSETPGAEAHSSR